MCDHAAPDTIRIANIEDDAELGLNGSFQRNGSFGGRPQWMKPGTRRYIRWIRDRWEIYVSHHPAGTTFFFHTEDSSHPPLAGWTPSEFVMPIESPTLTSQFESPTVDPRNYASIAGTAEGEDQNGQTKASSAALLLWCNNTCPFVQRVAIALHEKGLQAKHQHVDVIGEKDVEFVKAYRKTCPDYKRRPAIPVLEHSVLTDKGIQVIILVESKVIVEYLDSTYEDNPLLPSAAFTRAQSSLFVSAFESSLLPCEAEVLNASDMDALTVAGERLVEALRVVDTALRMSNPHGSGPFLGDEQFGYAEVVTAPHLQRLTTLLPHFRPQLPCGHPLDVMAKQFPRLHKWAAAVLARPSVEATYHLDDVISIKAKAVARFDHTGDVFKTRKDQSVAMLEAFFKSRIVGS